MAVQKLAHITKISKGSYEEKLTEILSKKMGIAATTEYRNRYLSSFDTEYLKLSKNLQSNTITVNISELCNFKCSMCDVPGNNKATSNLEIKQVLDFLDNAALNPAIICCILGSGSEITLHKDWKKLVSHAINIFPDTILFTNGSKLDDSDIGFLVNSGLTRLFISLDAASPETFKKIRGYDLLDKIETIIKNIIAFRSKVKSLTPLVRVSFVKQKENHEEIDKFTEKWIETVDSVEFQELDDISKFKDRNYVNVLPHLNVDGCSQPPKCHYPFSYLSLWSNGNISPCCNSYGRDSDELKLANINDENYMHKAMDGLKTIQNSFLSEKWDQIPNTCRHCLLN